MKPVLLSIAGLDPCGGAGLLMDQKAMARAETYAVGVVTALTVQNSEKLVEFKAIEAELVHRQLQVLWQDLPIAGVKIGMIPNLAILRMLMRFLQQFSGIPVVIDPILAASSGKSVLKGSMRDDYLVLLQQATLITPNRKEMAWLLKQEDISAEQREPALKELRSQLGVSVLLTGGHYEDNKSLLLEQEILEFREEKLELSARGTGCALSSLITAYLAKKMSMARAVAEANRQLHQWLLEARALGKGDALMG